jgi:hypothetical protein
MKDTKYVLERKNPKTGFKQTIVYTGNLTQKPKGWKVVRQIQ